MGWHAGDDEPTGLHWHLWGGGSSSFSFGKLGSRLEGKEKGGRSPLASGARPEVEETDLAGGAGASRHVSEAAAASGLRVAFAHIPGGSGGITAAC